jgi:hypothetical protein
MAEQEQVITFKVVPFKFRRFFEKDEKISSYEEFMDRIKKIGSEYPDESLGSVWMQGLREIRPVVYDLVHTSPVMCVHDKSEIPPFVSTFVSSFWDD